MTDTAIATATAAQVPAHSSAWKSASGFGFRDLLDIVNPLQHLPIISSIYRWVTGDRPGEAAKIAGDALYGGPIGVAFGLVGAAMEDSAGHDLGERALAALFDSGQKTTAVAAATSPAGATAPPAISVATPQGLAPPTAAAAAAAPAQAVSTASPAMPDHPPMPLFGGIAHMPPGAPPQQAQPHDEAARDFLARKAAMQRQVSGTARGPGATSAPIPLMVPAGALPVGRRENAPGVPVAATVASPPLDVSQKMLDALDKYMKLQHERKAGNGNGPEPPVVDLSL